MDKLRKVLSGNENRDDDSTTGIIPVSIILHYLLQVTFQQK